MEEKMKKHLFTLATMILVTLIVVSMSEAQVAKFRVVDPLGGGTVHLPVDGAFDIQFRADTSDITDSAFLRLVQFVVQIDFPFGGDMEPTNLDDPFTVNPALPTENDTPNGNSYDPVTNTLRFSYRASSGSGVPVGDNDILITTVNFTPLDTPGPARLIHQDVGLSTGTYYRIDNLSIREPTVDNPAIDIPLPIQLAAFTAVSADKGVMIEWRTESELNNLGFNVYRSTRLDGDYVKVTPALIMGAGTEATPREYSFIDADVAVGNTYYYYIEDVDFSGKTNRSQIIGVIAGQTIIIPIKSALLQNFPNPFNPETWIPYQLAQNASVTVRIYNLKGQSIRTIELGPKTAGTYLAKDRAVYWDGRDNVGEKVASGMYFYMLKAGEFMSTRRMVIIE